MKTIRISFITCLAVLLTSTGFAQRGRGYDRHYDRGHYYQPRSHFSLSIGPRYNYRPYYRPAPYYRQAPYYRPAYRPVYYRSPRTFVHFGPVFGFRLNVLPFGYSRIYVGGMPYYYNEGVYYRNYNNSSYEVVAPPLDAVVNKLPPNASVTMIDGEKYYQLGGTFYREEFDENNRLQYRVVGTDGVINTGNENDNGNDVTASNQYDGNAPAMGNRYDELPADSKVLVINQKKYFSSPGGVYYKEVIEGDKIRYEVTSVE